MRGSTSCPRGYGLRLVVCSDASSLPEIAGDAALIVSPHDDAGLVNAIR